MNDITLPRSVVEQALEAFTRGCPPDCKDGMTDSGGVYPWGEPALIRCPACRAFDALRAALERPQSVTDCHQSQPQGEPPGSTESAYQRGYLDGMAKGRRDAAMDADARVFYDHDTSEVDRYLGFKPTVPLYTHPQPKREPLTVGQINRLIADGKLPLSGNPYEVARAIERAHGIGGDA